MVKQTIVYPVTVTKLDSPLIWPSLRRKAPNNQSNNQPIQVHLKKVHPHLLHWWWVRFVDFDVESIISHVFVIFHCLDNIIKIWRLYPYAQESLAPLTSLYCAHTPVFMSIMRNKLNVAFQEHTNATYSVVMYNLERRSKYQLAFYLLEPINRENIERPNLWADFFEALQIELCNVVCHNIIFKKCLEGATRMLTFRKSIALLFRNTGIILPTVKKKLLDYCLVSVFG